MKSLAEPAVVCPACSAEIPLSSGWGPVGDKQFLCACCGELSELVVLGDSSGD